MLSVPHVERLPIGVGTASALASPTECGSFVFLSIRNIFRRQGIPVDTRHLVEPSTADCSAVHEPLVSC